MHVWKHRVVKGEGRWVKGGGGESGARPQILRRRRGIRNRGGWRGRRGPLVLIGWSHSWRAPYRFVFWRYLLAAVALPALQAFNSTRKAKRKRPKRALLFSSAANPSSVSKFSSSTAHRHVPSSYAFCSSCLVFPYVRCPHSSKEASTPP